MRFEAESFAGPLAMTACSCSCGLTASAEEGGLEARGPLLRTFGHVQREGRLVRTEVYTDRTKALDAAGLRE